MIKYCPECGSENKGDSIFCTNCGSKFPEELIYSNEENQEVANFNKKIENNKFKKEDFILIETSNCPLCDENQFNKYFKKSFLSEKKIYNCENCGLSFEKHKNKYKLINLNNEEDRIWLRYSKETLTKEEWIRIINGGISNKEEAEKQKEIARQKEIELKAAKENDLKIFTNSLVEGTANLTVANSPVILKKEEIAILSLKNITLMEARAVRVSSGTYGGPTIRVSKGVSFRVGASSARSESHDELKNVDIGTLTLTNKRFIYSGQKKTVDVNLSNIIAITEYKDGISLQRTRKQKMEYFTGTDKSKFDFIIEGRRQSTPIYGYILKAAILGQIANLDN